MTLDNFIQKIFYLFIKKKIHFIIWVGKSLFKITFLILFFQKCYNLPIFIIMCGFLKTTNIQQFKQRFIIFQVTRSGFHHIKILKTR